MSETTVHLTDDWTAEYTLDFIEQQMFYGYDTAYQAYTDAENEFEKENLEQELRAYDDALTAITHIRKCIEAEREGKIQNTGQHIA